MKKFTWTFFLTTASVFNGLNANVTEIQSHLQQRKPITSDCFMDILQNRYSGRSFDASRDVTEEQLNKLMVAASLAPSSYNEQPWRFIICHRNHHPDAFQKVFSTLVEFNQGWAKNAPVLVVAVASNKSSHNNKANLWAQYDTGAAAFSMMLEAHELGLMSHQMGGFDATKLSQLFAIPPDYTPISVMAIGYATPNDTVPSKQRKSLKENFFMGSWGQ